MLLATLMLLTVLLILAALMFLLLLLSMMLLASLLHVADFPTDFGGPAAVPAAAVVIRNVNGALL
jgi:hypothetical protein